MRLIDADALAEAMKKDNPQTSKNKWLQILIDNAPTIQLEPLVQVSEVTYSDRPHGKWMHSEDILEVECSNCGWPVLDIDQRGLPTFRKKAWRFCPNCGADMRGAK